ncbi:MAG TPA: zinc ribbon domain-containing protein [Aequorivita sp.]|nr:zinc ribbon domain-containing protein [Aequorivita sp.]
MYCIECGAQIPENSKFCSHCGQKQTEGEPSAKEKIAEKIIETEIVRQVVEEHKRNLDYEFLRKAMGWYLAWVVLHLGILLIFSDAIWGGDSFYMDKFVPFSKGSEIEYYDIREFLVYTLFPLALLIISSMVSAQNTENNSETDK